MVCIMGCCFGKNTPEAKWEGDHAKWVCRWVVVVIMSFTITPRDLSLGPRFWFLADSIRAGTLGLTGQQAHMEDAMYRVDVALVSCGELVVTLTPGEGHEQVELSLRATLHMVDHNVELINNIFAEARSGSRREGVGLYREREGVGVSFPIVELVNDLRVLSFFVLEVDLDVGAHHMENNKGFTLEDRDKFLARGKRHRMEEVAPGASAASGRRRGAT